jgi:hypothetical protein
MCGPLKAGFWVFVIGTVLMFAFEARQYQQQEAILEFQSQAGGRLGQAGFDPQAYRAAARLRTLKYKAEACFDEAVRAGIVNGEKDRDQIKLFALKSCHAVIGPMMQSRGISSAQIEEKLVEWGDPVFLRTATRMGINMAQ